MVTEQFLGVTKKQFFGVTEEFFEVTKNSFLWLLNCLFLTKKNLLGVIFFGNFSQIYHLVISWWMPTMNRS